MNLENENHKFWPNCLSGEGAICFTLAVFEVPYSRKYIIVVALQALIRD